MRKILDVLQANTQAARSPDRRAHTQGPENPEAEIQSMMDAVRREDRKENWARHGTDYIHASHFLGKPPCARMFYLLRVLREVGAEFKEGVFGNMRLVWAYGRAAENHFRTSALEDPDLRAKAFGKWVCKCKSTVHEGFPHPNPKPCPRCRSKPTNYAELTLIDKVHGVIGNPDFNVKTEVGGKLRVWELKSIKKDTSSAGPGFDEIESPVPNHVVQGKHYIEILREKGYDVHDAPIVCYILKDYVVRWPWYKPFLPSPALLAQATSDVRQHRAVGKAYMKALSTGNCPPMARDCAEDNNLRCKTCPAWGECMARNAAERAQS